MLDCGIYYNIQKECYGFIGNIKKSYYGVNEKKCIMNDDILQSCLKFKFTSDQNAKKKFYELNR
jgi:hypothetical protein